MICNRSFNKFKLLKIVYKVQLKIEFLRVQLKNVLKIEFTKIFEIVN